jgi:hypothetical protein
MLAKTTTCNTFQDYVKTLPKWDQALLLNVTEKSSTEPLYELPEPKTHYTTGRQRWWCRRS